MLNFRVNIQSWPDNHLKFYLLLENFTNITWQRILRPRSVPLSGQAVKRLNDSCFVLIDIKKEKKKREMEEKSLSEFRIREKMIEEQILEKMYVLNLEIC